MSYLPLLLSLLAVDLLAAISPGPNFVVVTQTAIQRGFRHGAAVVWGFVTSNLLWCGAVAFGLSVLFDLAPWLYRIIKFAGGAYLIYLGVSLWRSKSDTPMTESSMQSSLGAAYWRGLLTNLSNPKSVVYFGSIFALFMKPGTPVWVQAVAIGIVIVDTIAWYGTAAALFSSAVVQRRYVAMQRPINRVAGAVMVGFGARLILVRD
jgi:threonine efflux protein